MIRSMRLEADGKLVSDVALDRFAALRGAADGVLWVDLDRPSPTELQQVADAFGFHPLAVEDCLHLGQIPKIEDYDDHLFLVAHGLDAADPLDRIKTAEVELFLGARYLVTHHVRPVPAIDELLKRCARDPVHLIGRGSAEVAHLILDRMVDDFRPLINKLDDRTATLEEEVLHKPHRRTLAGIGRLKRDLLHLRRVLGPQRDVINRLARDPHPLVPNEIRPYFRDVYDHLMRVNEESEVLRDLLGGLRDSYLAGIANRTNEIVKSLTLVATALLPVNVLAAIYGMNFKTMPFADVEWGFFGMLGVMAVLATTALFVFRRSRWF